MYTKRLKKIGALITAIVMCIVCVINISGCGIVSDLSGKLFIGTKLSEYIDSKADELNTEIIRVCLDYKQTHEYTYEPKNFESYMAFCEQLETLNQQKFDELGLNDNIDETMSCTKQHICLSYSSYNDFLKSSDYDRIVESAESVDLLQVSIDIKDMSLRPIW